jgi:Mrp family chromosome partitioning ATPase
MTSLDQAFIKAFSRQDPVPLALSPRPAVPEKEKAASVPAPVSKEPEFILDQSVATGPFMSLSSFSGESIDTLGGSSLPTLEEVWAALEKSPKPTTLPQKMEEPRTVSSIQSLINRTGSSNPCETTSGYDGAIELPKGSEEERLSPPSTLRLPPLPTPLSPIALPPSPPPAPREFKPASQVDHFSWPKLCRRLLDRASGELDRLTDAIQSSGRQGNKVLAMGSYQRGEGATSLLLCAARRLGERGVKVVVFDADLDRPKVAKRLGVSSQFGWDETTDSADQSLDQAIVEATADSVAIVPVREPSAESGREPGDPSRLADCLKVLREHYDMVLVDVGPLEDGGLFNLDWGRAAAEWINAVIVVQNPGITTEDDQQSIERKLAVAGVAVVGIVENFVSDD